MFCPKCGAQNADDAQACAACGAEIIQPSQPFQSAQPEPTMMAAAPRTSPMAIISIILGVVGLFTCGVGAIVGLILGILGLKQINERPAEFTGKGLATAGIIVSAIMILVGLIVTPAAVMFPVFTRARETARQASCQANVRQLGTAMKMYLSDWQDTYPPAAQWCDSLKTYAMSPAVYQCPAAPDLKSGYAFNGALGGQPEGMIRSSDETACLFESDGGWNAHGGREAMITKPRHMGAVTVGFVNGRVRAVPPGSEGSIRWSP
jgi:hypothetical protein